VRNECCLDRRRVKAHFVVKFAPMPEGNESGVKWWIRYVAVPLVGGGGVIAIIVALIPPRTIPTINTNSLPQQNVPTVSSTYANNQSPQRPQEEAPRPPINFYAPSPSEPPPKVAHENTPRDVEAAPPKTEIHPNSGITITPIDVIFVARGEHGEETHATDVPLFVHKDEAITLSWKVEGLKRLELVKEDEEQQIVKRVDLHGQATFSIREKTTFILREVVPEQENPLAFATIKVNVIE
jgi:hypothetical protein